MPSLPAVRPGGIWILNSGSQRQVEIGRDAAVHDCHQQGAGQLNRGKKSGQRQVEHVQRLCVYFHFQRGKLRAAQ